MFAGINIKVFLIFREAGENPARLRRCDTVRASLVVEDSHCINFMGRWGARFESRVRISAGEHSLEVCDVQTRWERKKT